MTNRKGPLPKTRRLAPIRPPSGAEMLAGRRLAELAERVQMDTLEIVDWIRAGNVGPIQVANALQEKLELWRSVNTSVLAREWTRAVDDNAKRLLTDRVKTALRVDTAFILDNDTVREEVELAARLLEKKIVQIPEAYIEGVADAAIQAYKRIPFPEGRTLAQQLMHVGEMSFERARFIARHQTSVINATVNRVRQTAIGIEEYYWSSSYDRRTVGNPDGKYPAPSPVHGHGHGDHWARDYRNNNNQAYRWDQPFPDGLPGEAYNCRCKAIAKMEPARLNTEAVLVGEAATLGFRAPRQTSVSLPGTWETAA